MRWVAAVMFACLMASSAVRASDPCNDLRENIATLTDEAQDLIAAMDYLAAAGEWDWYDMAQDELIANMNQVAAWRDQYTALYCFE